MYNSKETNKDNALIADLGKKLVKEINRKERLENLLIDLLESEKEGSTEHNPIYESEASILVRKSIVQNILDEIKKKNSIIDGHRKSISSLSNN